MQTELLSIINDICEADDTGKTTIFVVLVMTVAFDTFFAHGPDWSSSTCNEIDVPHGLVLNPTKSEAIQFGPMQGINVNDNQKSITVVSTDILLSPMLNSVQSVLVNSMYILYNMRGNCFRQSCKPSKMQHSKVKSRLLELLGCMNVDVRQKVHITLAYFVTNERKFNNNTPTS